MNKKVLLISSLLFSAMAYSQTIKGRIVQETPSVSALKVLVKKEGKELVYPVDEKGAFDISKCGLMAYANGGYYPLGKKIGQFGFSVMKKSTKKKKGIR